MALVGRRNGRNFGYSRQLSYAGPQALRDLFGGGHYGTVKAHSDRWQAFVRWCRSEDGPGFNDARKIDRQTLLDYAGHLRQQAEGGAIGIATAQNRLSSVNRTMAALRGDPYVKVPSPSKALGMQRTSVRRSVPQGQDREQLAAEASPMVSGSQDGGSIRSHALLLPPNHTVDSPTPWKAVVSSVRNSVHDQKSGHQTQSITDVSPLSIPKPPPRRL